MTDKKIGKIAFEKFGLQEGDQDYIFFIEGYKLAMSKQFAITDVGRSTYNLEIAIKHLEKRKKDFNNTITCKEVIEILYFLKQANEQALDLIGIGYHRYDGGNVEDIKTENMYEGGFLVKK